MAPARPDAELVPGGERPRASALVGPRIALEPLDPERDLDDLFEASHGDAARDAIWDWMPVGPFADRDQMRAFLEERAGAPDLVAFAVVDRATDERVGMTSYMSIDVPARRLEVGFIWYSLAHRGGRTNDEAMLLMLGEAFERLGYRRVEWKCDADNERSRRAALRLGFTFEGIFRQHLIVKGRNRDTAWFSMLDSEWPQVREALTDSDG